MEDKNQELTGYNNSKGLQYINIHLKKYNLLMKTFFPQNLNPLKKFIVTIDFVLCALKYGSGINDYFQYNFYRRRANDRKTFIVGRKWIKLVKICNGTIKQSDFDDKSRFNSIFRDYIGRAWIDIDKSSKKQYQEFIEKYPNSMYKVKNGSGGNGIGICDELFRKKHSYEELKNKHLILEEIIEQNKELAEFNPSSVNTLRVVTIVSKDKVNLMNAVFRMGNGRGRTDNFHHYGLAALIDCESGVVISPAVDKKNNKYYFHPLSGKQIIGYHIPHWSEVVTTVKKAARVRANVRYVGWDITLDKNNKVCIIEGNCASDPDITQMPDQIGKWPYYKKMLKNF